MGLAATWRLNVLYLKIVPDAALLERSRVRILDGEVPTTEDLVAHIHTVTFPEHPGVFVANYRPVTQSFRWEAWTPTPAAHAGGSCLTCGPPRWSWAEGCWQFLLNTAEACSSTANPENLDGRTQRRLENDAGSPAGRMEEFRWHYKSQGNS